MSRSYELSDGLPLSVISSDAFNGSSSVILMTPLPAGSDTKLGVTLMYVLLSSTHKFSNFFTSLRSVVVGVMTREKPSRDEVIPPVNV